jgi:hypothetical protein
MEWRQAIEKQLNKGELANKFSAAISFADPLESPHFLFPKK